MQSRAVCEQLQRNIFELEQEAQLKDVKLSNLRRDRADTLVLCALPSVCSPFQVLCSYSFQELLSHRPTP